MRRPDTIATFCPALQAASLLAMLFFCGSASHEAYRDNATPGRNLSEVERKWVEERLKALTLEEKIGQMLQVRYYADYPDFQRGEYVHLREELRKYHIGSVVFGMHFNKSGPVRSSALDAAKIANQLQSDSELPLLLAADLERGVASRLRDVPDFPWPMAL